MVGKSRCRHLVVGALLVGLAGCAPSADEPATPITSPSETLVAPTPVSVSDYCAAAPGSPALEQRSLPGADGAVLNTAWLGGGRTVAVLLHQTDGNGLCGFIFYADYLAKRDLRVALLDLCGYGQSNCAGSSLADDPVAQVAAVTEAARTEGAERVVLVGASMGGSVAVSAAAAVQADAVVDLSGPAQFGSSSISRDAPTITMPALFAFSGTDQADLAAIRRKLPAMPTQKKTLLTYDTGHGYDLLRDLASGTLTPLAPRVATFVAG